MGFLVVFLLNPESSGIVISEKALSFFLNPESPAGFAG
jgi:hypothetical protein